MRFRIDGKLLERHVIEKGNYAALVNQVKILANLDISEKRLPQDGRILHDSGGCRFDVRVSSLAHDSWREDRDAVVNSANRVA